MRARVVVVMLLVTLAPIAHAMDGEGEELLVNGSFEQWTDGRPDGWSVTVGATEGEGPESSLQPGQDSGPGSHCLSLIGSRETQRWLAATQALAIVPGDMFRVACRLRSRDVRRDGHRYGNSQAAVVAKAADGQRVNMWILGPAVGTADWASHETWLQAPLGAASLEVAVFLSMSGALECDDLSLTRVQAPQGDPDASRDGRWQTDVAYLAEFLPRLHVDPFTMTSEDAFRASAAGLAAAVGDLNDLQLNLRLMALVASLGDAHTTAAFATQPTRLPIQFEFFGDDLRVLAVTRACADLAGGIVTRIGDHDIANVLAAVRPLIPCETTSWFRRQAPQFLRLAEVLEGLGYTEPTGGVTVTVRAEDGHEHRCVVAPAEPGQKLAFEIREPAAAPLYLSDQATYWYRYLEDSRTFYLQYNRCREDRQRPMADFTSEVAAALDAQPVDRFILDVRHNGGGGSQLLNPLIAAVAGRKDAGGIARCYVITGRATFSAAALNTLDFRRATGALVVGEPMGNKPNRFGQLNAFVLPGSGLRVQYATKHFVRVEGDPPLLAPDLPASPSWEEYTAGRDPALEVILR